jgi:hypothetical protein
MPDPIRPGPKAKVKSTIENNLSNDTLTAAQAHPPLEAWSTTASVAVLGNNTSNGCGVFGGSAAGDGVHGESKGESMSGVAGIHNNGGKGVYGRSSGNAGYFDGNVVVNGNLTATGDILLPGGDCAEQFDCIGEHGIEAGSLVVVGEDGVITECEAEYDHRVAGVVAGAGTFRPAIVLNQQTSNRRCAAVSLIGRAYCKVDAEYGAIEVGDLLTSSPSVGHAMKASDRDRAFGTVVGKALQAWRSGRGMIPILLALQ